MWGFKTMIHRMEKLTSLLQVFEQLNDLLVFLLYEVNLLSFIVKELFVFFVELFSELVYNLLEKENLGSFSVAGEKFEGLVEEVDCLEVAYVSS